MSDDNKAPAGVDANTAKSNEIARSVLGTGVKPEGLRIEFNNGTATVRGSVQSEDERKRVIDAVRSAGGVTSVTDSLTLGAAKNAGVLNSTGGSGSRSYTVKSGDTLSKIAQAHYGEGGDYNKIFEANRTILSDADKIQPGQVLTIPE